MSNAVKRDTTLNVYTGLAAAPADFDFFVDGRQAELYLWIENITGTSIAVNTVELMSDGWTLPYDGQTANFTVGAKVKGYPLHGGGSPAEGIIVDDVDGGAAGTLIVSNVKGKFEDNMIIRDDNATQGVALVNSATGGSQIYVEGGNWAAIGATAVDAQATFKNPGFAAGDGGDLGLITHRKFRLKFTAVALTNLDMSVGLVQKF